MSYIGKSKANAKFSECSIVHIEHFKLMCFISSKFFPDLLKSPVNLS